MTNKLIALSRPLSKPRARVRLATARYSLRSWARRCGFAPVNSVRALCNIQAVASTCSVNFKRGTDNETPSVVRSLDRLVGHGRRGRLQVDRRAGEGAIR